MLTATQGKHVQKKEFRLMLDKDMNLGCQYWFTWSKQDKSSPDIKTQTLLERKLNDSIRVLQIMGQ